MNIITEITMKDPISSVSELIDIERSLWEESNYWAFRGQPREFGTLTPSLQRQFSRKSSGSAEIVESSLINAFREHYENLSDKSEEMPKMNQISQGYDLRCLSVMQHYEIPTRLLDWTSDFWIALYFACASDPGENAELWAYERKIFNPQNEKNTEHFNFLDTSTQVSPEPIFLNSIGDDLIIELDVQITPRMKEQKAHHTVCSNVFSDHAPLLFKLQLENSKDNKTAGHLLKRMIISSSCKSKLLQFLTEYKKITASTIFPDVVGLGRFLRWQFENLRTMLF